VKERGGGSGFVLCAMELTGTKLASTCVEKVLGVYLYAPCRLRICTHRGYILGCSDFDFFHILRYNHPSLTLKGPRIWKLAKKNFNFTRGLRKNKKNKFSKNDFHILQGTMSHPPIDQYLKIKNRCILVYIATGLYREEAYEEKKNLKKDCTESWFRYSMLIQMRRRRKGTWTVGRAWVLTFW